MKPHNLSASSSMKSNSSTETAPAIEERCVDSSSYYPGCKKDANCNCEICLASINATLDLMPASIQKSSLTKISASRPNVEKTPLSFDPSIASTPRSSSCVKFGSPFLKSTARMRLDEIKEMKEKEKEKRRRMSPGFVGGFWKLVIGLGLVLAVEAGFSLGVRGILRPVFSSDVVRSVNERSLIGENLSGRLRFLQDGLKGLVALGEVSNCSYMDSNWEINQDGLLLNSRCTLYKSAMEEVSVWGWPLQTAGLLKAGISARFFTVLSGRVTEWPDGKIGYSVHKANASWVHRKWGASVVQLDPNTWVLEYRRNWVLENSRLLPAIVEVFKYKMSRALKNMNIESLLFSGFEDRYLGFKSRHRAKIPT